MKTIICIVLIGLSMLSRAPYVIAQENTIEVRPVRFTDEYVGMMIAVTSPAPLLVKLSVTIQLTPGADPVAHSIAIAYAAGDIVFENRHIGIVGMKYKDVLTGMRSWTKKEGVSMAFVCFPEKQMGGISGNSLTVDVSLIEMEKYRHVVDRKTAITVGAMREGNVVITSSDIPVCRDFIGRQSDEPKPEQPRPAGKGKVVVPG